MGLIIALICYTASTDCTAYGGQNELTPLGTPATSADLATTALLHGQDTVKTPVQEADHASLHTVAPTAAKKQAAVVSYSVEPRGLHLDSALSATKGFGIDPIGGEIGDGMDTVLEHLGDAKQQRDAVQRDGSQPDGIQRVEVQDGEPSIVIDGLGNGRPPKPPQIPQDAILPSDILQQREPNTPEQALHQKLPLRSPQKLPPEVNNNYRPEFPEGSRSDSYGDANTRAPTKRKNKVTVKAQVRDQQHPSASEFDEVKCFGEGQSLDELQSYRPELRERSRSGLRMNATAETTPKRNCDATGKAQLQDRRHPSALEFDEVKCLGEVQFLDEEPTQLQAHRHTNRKCEYADNTQLREHQHPSAVNTPPGEFPLWRAAPTPAIPTLPPTLPAALTAASTAAPTSNPTPPTSAPTVSTPGGSPSKEQPPQVSAVPSEGLSWGGSLSSGSVCPGWPLVPTAPAAVSPTLTSLTFPLPLGAPPSTKLPTCTPQAKETLEPRISDLELEQHDVGPQVFNTSAAGATKVPPAHGANGTTNRSTQMGHMEPILKVHDIATYSTSNGTVLAVCPYLGPHFTVTVPTLAPALPAALTATPTTAPTPTVGAAKTNQGTRMGHMEPILKIRDVATCTTSSCMVLTTCNCALLRPLALLLLLALTCKGFGLLHTPAKAKDTSLLTTPTKQDACKTSPASRDTSRGPQTRKRHGGGYAYPLHLMTMFTVLASCSAKSAPAILNAKV
jgi:hypothetical protein